MLTAESSAVQRVQQEVLLRPSACGNPGSSVSALLVQVELIKAWAFDNKNASLGAGLSDPTQGILIL